MGGLHMPDCIAIYFLVSASADQATTWLGLDTHQSSKQHTFRLSKGGQRGELNPSGLRLNAILFCVRLTTATQPCSRC